MEAKLGRTPLGPAGVNQATGARCLGPTRFHPHASGYACALRSLLSPTQSHR